MYPDVFSIGPVTVTSFGLMVGLGALVGLWIFARELRFDALPSGAVDVALLAVLAGLIGSKLLYVVEHVGEEPLLDLVGSRGGMSWFGGLAAALGFSIWRFRRNRWPVIPLLAAATPALAIGHLLGRIGCFLVGDDYGEPTSLPWGVAFPRGLPPTTVPVHPTQLYEAALLGVLFLFLIQWRRARHRPELVLGRYLLIAGAARFAIEFLRTNTRVRLGLSVAHWASAAVVTAGAALLIGHASGDRRQAFGRDQR